MGGGTTGILCKEVGYDFIGIKMDKDMLKVGEQRINKSGEDMFQ